MALLSRQIVYSVLFGLAGAWAGLRAECQQNPAGLALPATAEIQDKFMPLMPSEVHLRGGFLGTRVAVNEKQRLLQVDENDLLDAFERRETPHQDWQGEHVGKFLHAAALAWANTRDPRLKAKMDRVVRRLLKTQEAGGYLGTYPRERRWTSWDVWVHKYDLLGLLTYYQCTHSAPALTSCRRIGNLLTQTFGDRPGQRSLNDAGEHVGMAATSVLEPIVLLYRATGDRRYLQFAQSIVSRYDAPRGPAILTSLEKYRSVRRVADAKAYEMASNFEGLLELYRAGGDSRLLNDVQIAWSDIVRNRLYLTGTASSFEVFQDDFHFPDMQSAHIGETCFTVTWEQMNLQMLRLTGDARYADQAECSIYNHLLAAQKPSGDDWCYYTPLEGHKQYDRDTTCCHSSGPRGIALIPSLAVMASADGGLVINLYNTGTVATRLPSGPVTLTQETRYPLDGTVTLHLHPHRNGQIFPLRLRIPAWTIGASITVNGRPQGAAVARPGTYAVVNRAWRNGDTVTLRIPLVNRLVLGDHNTAGKAAVMTGPLVLALDTEQNAAPLRRTEMAADRMESLSLRPVPERSVHGEPVFAVGSRTAGAAPIYLVPFAFAGQDGRSQYEVWIARPGQAGVGLSGFLLSGGTVTTSRKGNLSGDITDDDFSTSTVTFNGQKADRDWYAVTLPRPITIRRVVFAHGQTFHDGGWFDVAGFGRKPQVQVQTQLGSAWITVGALASYPETTAISAAGLQNGQKFEVNLLPVAAIAVRVIGAPACGDNSAQSFSSCAELQAFNF